MMASALDHRWSTDATSVSADQPSTHIRFRGRSPMPRTLMSRTSIRWAVTPVATVSLTALLAACGHKPAPAPAPAPVAAAPSAPPSTPSPVTPVADDGAARRALEAARNALTQMMYFDYDRADLSPEDRATL